LVNVKWAVFQLYWLLVYVNWAVCQQYWLLFKAEWAVFQLYWLLFNVTWAVFQLYCGMKKNNTNIIYIKLVNYKTFRNKTYLCI
jgi:hypothetical protein